MRLIDADALVQMLENDAKHMEDITGRMWTYAAINDIKNAPTADVPDRKVGKWVEEIGMLMCSECGDAWGTEQFDEVMSFNYCPNCGADLRG